MTIVTAFYEIPSKHPQENYSKWISNFMNLNINCIIFIDPKGKLQTIYPENDKRKYFLLSFEDFKTSHWDFSFDLSVDRETRVGHNIQLYKIWNEKIFFIERAIELDAYNDEFFIWMDIGCVRDSEMPKILNERGFPDTERMRNDKITMLQIEGFLEREINNLEVIDERFRNVNRIGGTMFGGPRDILERFAKIHFDTLEEATHHKIFKGKDQSLYAFEILRNPELFDVLNGRNLLFKALSTPWQSQWIKYKSWFLLQPYLCSKKFSIIFVGPGIMSIPPRGWGAVEALIWNYTVELRRLGHTVNIINDKNPRNALQLIKDTKPDVVHVQYDEFSSFAKDIASVIPVVILTSHFGYLDQEQRWNGYKQIFENSTKNIPPNFYTFALSDSIKNVFERRGVQRVFTVPNGACSESFFFNETPAEANTAVYLAKIDYRKRQHLFTGIDFLYFVGNYADDRFPKTHKNYLGEWEKDKVHRDLTNFTSLVLLSDGEADPLVVKEAFMAGLGVVISEYSTANLDLSLPFITVIPESKIHDVNFIREQIIKNMNVSLPLRKSIRKYGIDNFSWKVRTEHYLNVLHGCPELSDPK